jgi:hypothetical protein
LPYTTTTDRTTGYVVTAVDWNIVEDNLTYLYGDTGWTNMAGFTNSWTSLTAPNVARYRLQGTLVVVQGVITGGTLSTTAFTFPAGYRPTEAHSFATTSSSAFGSVNISTAGLLSPVIGSTTNVSICTVFSVL